MVDPINPTAAQETIKGMQRHYQQLADLAQTSSKLCPDERRVVAIKRQVLRVWLEHYETLATIPALEEVA
jgi:hypothetical protein